MAAAIHNHDKRQEEKRQQAREHVGRTIAAAVHTAETGYSLLLAAAEKKVAEQKALEAELKRIEEEKAWRQQILQEQQAITASLESSLSSAGGQSAPSGSGDWWPIFVAAGQMYGQDPNELWRVALCESCNGCPQPDPSADNGVCKGMFQFHPGTWASTPYGNRSIWDGEAQIYAAAWMWSQGRQNEWTCY